jgi:hypothetical protein
LSISRFFTTARASVLLVSEVYRLGMRTPVTFSGPRARAATAAPREESIPPESPNTAREKPFFLK